MSDEIASRLSGKLLQGWCMLDKSCDKCNTPIMRDKQKKEYCCGCQKFIGAEEEVKVEKVAASVATNVVTSVVNGNVGLRDKFEKCAEKFLDKLLGTEGIEDYQKITQSLFSLSQAFQNFGFK